MSVKIYFAGRIPCIPMLDLINKCQLLREKAEELRKSLILHDFGNGEKITRQEWAALQARAWDVRKDPFNGDSLADYSLEVGFYPVDGFILYRHFCEYHRANYRSLVDDILEGKEFGYWDNTDKPDDVSEEEWQIRRDSWEVVMNRGITNFECGFHIQILTHSLPLCWQEV